MSHDICMRCAPSFSPFSPVHTRPILPSPSCSITTMAGVTALPGHLSKCNDVHLIGLPSLILSRIACSGGDGMGGGGDGDREHMCGLVTGQIDGWTDLRNQAEKHESSEIARDQCQCWQAVS
jgi:hypothetical protein